MKNGVVLELYKNHVAVLTPEGEFLKVRKDPQLCYIGEEIWFRASDIEIPGVINKLKERFATPKFLFQTAALATGFLLFFTSGLNTYMANALSGQGFLASAFDSKREGTGKEDVNHTSGLAANSNGINEYANDKISNVSQIIGKNPAVAYNNEQKQILDTNPTTNEVPFEQNGLSDGLSDVLSNNLSETFVDTPDMNSALDNSYFTADFGGSNVSFPVNIEIADIPIIGDIAGNSNISKKEDVIESSSNKKIEDDSSSHSLITDKGFVAFANDNQSSNNEVDTSTKPETSVDRELSDAKTPLVDEIKDNNIPNNNITQPSSPIKDTDNKPPKVSNQDDEVDTSGLAPEYVAGLETGKDKENTNSNQETDKSKEDSNTSTSKDNSGSGNTENSSSDSNSNVDMSATCEKDGYYYENERILTFDKDENGKAIEVYKDVPIKKYCDDSQQSSSDDKSGETSEEPTSSSSESEEKTATENNESTNTEPQAGTENPTETNVSAETETQDNTDSSNSSTTEEVPPTESLSFG
ncbi:anti-sigma factor domain-containing protein [Priestia aryabhattai]|uniref:Anti-sigma factor domain-containing protein n=1 Tax=Priestia aryabhattai TaxID=412384 RepID=A0AAX6NC59_PRIAR|nr:anti-sigma factor domain-containing protein [Priestia aryabhattai]MDU9693260.1 anti-sigma factor domain-containing protein [Priestia aryabhattai]